MHDVYIVLYPTIYTVSVCVCVFCSIYATYAKLLRLVPYSVHVGVHSE